jgi:hypothetical protein
MAVLPKRLLPQVVITSAGARGICFCIAPYVAPGLQPGMGSLARKLTDYQQ